jgi:HSP90 family molecular chaperone
MVFWKFLRSSVDSNVSSVDSNVIGAKFEALFRFLQERSRKETKSYLEFYKDYSFFLKEGIVTSTEKLEKEEIAKLLRFSFLFCSYFCIYD